MARRYAVTATSVRDKTSAFRMAVAEARGAQSKTSYTTTPVRSARHALLEDDALSSSSSRPNSTPATAPGKRRGEFAERAQMIFLDVARTSEKLGNLAQLVQRRNLFDDRSVEISQLTQVIKADLAAINSQIAGLQQLNNKNKPNKGSKGTKAITEHQGNVVTMLQSSLAGATSSFQDILETRTQTMKASHDRTGQYAYATTRPTPSAETSDSPLYRNRRPPMMAAAAAHRQLPGYDLGLSSSNTSMTSRASTPTIQPNPTSSSTSNSKQAANTTALAEEGMGQGGTTEDGEYLALDMGNTGNSFTQMQLVDRQDDYVQQRSRAIESIESTISELGQMFSQLAHMVAAQGETVQRIDADVFDISDNITGAQGELLRYYNRISSNRGLMLKIFGIIIIFFLLFILVS